MVAKLTIRSPEPAAHPPDAASYTRFPSLTFNLCWLKLPSVLSKDPCSGTPSPFTHSAPRDVDGGTHKSDPHAYVRPSLFVVPDSYA